MAITYEYFYTVEAHTDYKSYVTNTGGTDISNRYADLGVSTNEWVHKEYSVSGTGKVNNIYTGPATEAAPFATTIKCKKDYAIAYIIKFYLKKTVDGGTPVYYFLTDDCLSDVSSVLGSSANTQFLSKTEKRNPGDSGYRPSTMPNVIGPSAGTCYRIVIGITKSSFKQPEPFTTTAKVTPSFYHAPDGSTPHGTATPQNITNAMIAGVKPGLNCTDAAVIPSAPPSFLVALTARDSQFPAGGTYLNFGYSYSYDACTKDVKKPFIGVKWLATRATTGPYKDKPVIWYQEMSIDKNGDYFVKGSRKEDPYNKRNYPSSDNLEAVLKKIIAAKTGNCGAEADGGGGGGDGGGAKDSVMVRPVQPADALRWNPPPHVDSRGVNYTHRIDRGKFFSDDGSELDPSDFKNIVNTYIGARPERGRLFQDKQTAAALNRVVGVSLKTKTAQALQWGFRFMYNPEMISYENSDKSGVDWTYGSKDVGTLLNGSQTINFDLLINRIPDMSYLQLFRNSDANRYTQMDIINNNISIPAAYGRALEGYEMDGILTRGTEYDIEFLYRVLTGDPLPNSLLLEKGSKGLTADIGYTTMSPVWLVLHENMRFFGAVSSIGVTHRIFDQNMVPMLSRLSIGFQRYPAQEGKPPNTQSTGTSV